MRGSALGEGQSCLSSTVDDYRIVDSFGRRRSSITDSTTAIAAAIAVVIHGMTSRLIAAGDGGGAFSATLPALAAWLIELVCAPMTLA